MGLGVIQILRISVSLLSMLKSGWTKNTTLNSTLLYFDYKIANFIDLGPIKNVEQNIV